MTSSQVILGHLMLSHDSCLWARPCNPARVCTDISKLNHQGFVNKKIARLTSPQRASSRVKPEPKTTAPAPLSASSRVKPQPKKGTAG